MVGTNQPVGNHLHAHGRKLFDQLRVHTGEQDGDVFVSPCQLRRLQGGIFFGISQLDTQLFAILFKKGLLVKMPVRIGKNLHISRSSPGKMVIV